MTAMIRATEAMGEAATKASESLFAFMERDAARARAEREDWEASKLMSAALAEVAESCTGCGGADGTQRSRVVRTWRTDDLDRSIKVVGAPALCDDCAEGAS